MVTEEKSPAIANTIRDFIKMESAGGILLMVSAILALLVANSPLSVFYEALLDTTVAVQVGALIINKPLLLWVNDGLMAVFFFLIGLEIKREITRQNPYAARYYLLFTTPGGGTVQRFKGKKYGCRTKRIELMYCGCALCTQ